MGSKIASFRIGRVRAFQRGSVWYLIYYEHGRRHQPRVGRDRAAARQLAAEVNGQLEVGSPSSLGFQPISIIELRQRWLDQHEHVRRSSLGTVRRYYAATAHLLEFLADVRPVGRVSDFRSQHAEEFVCYLRSKKVTPNGHKNARKRKLLDGGIKYILETCCSLFNYAARHRHLPPYADNPFRTIEVSRIPVEDARPVIALSQQQQVELLEACDDWQFPVFLTLLFTGMRPGELAHLLLPDDLDLETGWLRIRNKPSLGWQIKTRNERDIPLMPVLLQVLRRLVRARRSGPVFVQRRCHNGHSPLLLGRTATGLAHELARRLDAEEASTVDPLTRETRAALYRTIWRDLGALKEDWLRKEFMQLMQKIDMPEVTATKTLRHTFATTLQDGNVDPLIRNELMGHAPMSPGTSGTQLGMTAVYTHTRPETKRTQLEFALSATLANTYANRRIDVLKANEAIDRLATGPKWLAGKTRFRDEVNRPDVTTNARRCESM